MTAPVPTLVPSLPFVPLLFQTPDEWVSALSDACEAITQGLEQAVADASRRIEEADPALLDALGFALGVGPGVVWAAGASDHAKQQLRDKLASAARRISDELDKLREAVFEEVDQVMGDPARLMGAARRMIEVKKDLDDLASRTSVNREHVVRYWRGRSERAYLSATGAQAAAASSYSEWLVAAALLVGDAAGAISKMWSDLLHEVVELGRGLLEDLASAFDVGNAFAFEVGPILSSVATAIGAVEGIGRTVREAGARAETTMALQWQAIGSSQAAPGGRWPRVDELDLSDLTDPDRWRL